MLPLLKLHSAALLASAGPWAEDCGLCKSPPSRLSAVPAAEHKSWAGRQKPLLCGDFGKWNYLHAFFFLCNEESVVKLVEG